MPKKYRYNNTIYTLKQEFPCSVMLGCNGGDLVSVSRSEFEAMKTVLNESGKFELRPIWEPVE